MLTVPEILCIAMQILLAVAGIPNNYMIWMVQGIILHGIPGGTAASIILPQLEHCLDVFLGFTFTQYLPALSAL